MEGLTFLPEDFNLQQTPVTRTPTIDNSLKVIQNYIIKHIDDNNIELISCEAQDVQYLDVNPAGTNSDVFKNRTRPILSKPERVMLDVTIYSCFKCNEQFNSLTLFRQHLKWHKASKNFNCPKCPAGFNAENNLKIHMVINHPGILDVCPICRIGFQRKASLKCHVMVHQVDELFVCDECHGEFQNDDELLKHMESHATTRLTKVLSDLLVCPYCKLDNKTLAEYKQHIAKHVEVKKNVLKGKRIRRKKANEKGTYKCKYCGKVFPKVCLLERHERIHTGEKPYKCQFCDRAFAQKGTLQIHLDKHTGLKPYSCTLCSAKFSQKGNLRAHVEKTHTAPKGGHKVYRCTQCTCIFRKIATLNGHMTKVHLNQPEEDPEDSRNIIDKVMESLRELHSELGKSALKQDEPKLFEASNATGMSLVKLAESQANGGIKRYMVHQKKIGDVRWYFCNYCPRRFKKPSDLIRHFRTHTLEKPFQCSKCNQAFSLKSTLVNHNKIHEKLSCQCDNCPLTRLRSQENDIPANFICILCDKVFPTIEGAKSHRSEHEDQTHGAQNIIEPVLKQPLLDSVPLKAPKPKVPNTGAESPLERPHHCKTCDARFTRLMSLKRHMLHHNGEKKFKCILCPKAFITKYRLKEHVNFHKNIKNFVCTTCGKKFVTSSLLKRHAIVHNSHRPYVCPYCDKTFKTGLLCRSHIKNIHSTTDKNKNQESVETVEKPDVIDSAALPTVENPLVLDVSPEIPENMQPGFQMVYLNINDLPVVPSDGAFSADDSYLFTPLDLFSIDAGTSQETNDIISEIGTPSQEPPLTNEAEFGGLPISIIDTLDETGGDLIPYDAQVICINCHKMFSNYDVFEKHACSVDTGQAQLIIQSDVTNVENQLQSELDKMKKFTYKKPLLADVKRAEQVKEYVCKRCDFVTPSDDVFRKHLLLHPNVSEKICKFCLKEFKKMSDLKRHLRTHTGEKPFECELCHKKFSLKSTLESHMRTHEVTGLMRVSCDVCNSTFTSKSSLKVHMLLHTGARPHACLFCKQTFRTSAIRKAHEKNIHLSKPHQSSSDKPKMGGPNIVRAIAEQVAEDIRREAENRHDVQPGSVDSMFFLQPIENSSLILAPVSPNLGDIAISDVPDLDTDIKNDTKVIQKQPRVECDICHKLYSSKDVLRKHKRTLHGQNRKFPCIKCDKGYDQLEDLQKHIVKLHTGHRPYACQYCANSFSEENSLKTHIKRIHQKSLMGLETASAILGLQYDLSTEGGYL